MLNKFKNYSFSVVAVLSLSMLIISSVEGHWASHAHVEIDTKSDEDRQRDKESRQDREADRAQERIDAGNGSDKDRATVERNEIERIT